MAKLKVAILENGPAMVILLAVFFLLGFVLSPRYGLLGRLRAGTHVRHGNSE